MNPLQGSDFDGLTAPPGLPVNQFRFVQAIDGFRQGVVDNSLQIKTFTLDVLC